MSDDSLKPGDTVAIIAGPFAGGRGLVQAVDAERKRVRVVMPVLGEPAPFSVGIEQIKIVRPPAHGH